MVARLAPKSFRKKVRRESLLVTVSDGCGNAIEFKGLCNIADVYAVQENETVAD